MEHQWDNHAVRLALLEIFLLPNIAYFLKQADLMDGKAERKAKRARVREEKAQRKGHRAKLRQEKADRKAARAEKRQRKVELKSSTDNKPQVDREHIAPGKHKRKLESSDLVRPVMQDVNHEAATKKKRKKERQDPNRKSRRQQTREYLLNREDTAGVDVSDAVPLTEEQQQHMEQRATKFRAENDIRVVNVVHTGSTTKYMHIESSTAVASTEPYKIPLPFLTFESTPFCKPIRLALDNAGYTAPTATQAQAWPICMQGRDVISVAKTGSGKTIGFLLPAFHLLEKIRYDPVEKEKEGLPKILVLAPTRELACQIHEESVKFGRSVGIKSVCLYGGAPRRGQVH
jgi:hypothetical protein